MKYLNGTSRIVFTTIIMVIAAISVSCNAATNQKSEKSSFLNTHDCSQSSTQINMDACREKAYKKVSEKLSLILEKHYVSYEKEEPRLKPVFLAAQTKWVEFVNAECEFSTYYSRGGAGYNAYFLGCLELKTLKRIQYLESVLKSP